jgi:hypothetical protein
MIVGAGLGQSLCSIIEELARARAETPCASERLFFLFLSSLSRQSPPRLSCPVRSCAPSLCCGVFVQPAVVEVCSSFRSRRPGSVVRCQPMQLSDCGLHCTERWAPQTACLLSWSHVCSWA